MGGPHALGKVGTATLADDAAGLLLYRNRILRLLDALDWAHGLLPLEAGLGNVLWLKA
jgi:hypothetical protein